MSRQMDAFQRPRRATPRAIAHVIDAGESPSGPVALYRCRRCGWESGWVEERRPVSSIKRGLPCGPCNDTMEEQAR